MTLQELQFKAEPDGQLFTLAPHRKIAQGDFLRWHESAQAFTSVDAGSPLIGQAVGAREIRRIVRKTDASAALVLKRWEAIPKISHNSAKMDDKEMRCEVLMAVESFTALASDDLHILLLTPLGLVLVYQLKDPSKLMGFEWFCSADQTVHHFWMNFSSVQEMLAEIRNALVVKVPMASLVEGIV